MKVIFATTILLAAAASDAGAACFDKRGVQYPALAVADASGTVVVSTLTGGTMRVRGFAPGAEVCRNLLFASAAKKCPGGKAKLDTKRDPKFCKGVSQGQTCVHIQCDDKDT